MTANNLSGFRARVLSHEWLAGSFINLGSCVTAEIAGQAGFDWLLLDYEHGPGSDDTLLHQLQAVSSTEAMSVVRIAANETPRFKRVLDLGAQGVMVPYVNTALEAQAAVAASRFPPRGVRGVAKFNRVKVAEAAKRAGKAAGILLMAPPQLPTIKAEGYTVVALGSDGGAVTSGLRQNLAVLRG